MSKKEKAKAFVQAALSQDADKARALVHPDYIQHNPFIPTGLESFIGLFPVLKEHGTSAQPVRMIEDGDYVVIHHLWKGAAPFGADEMVSFDVLRFDESGKIAEHWDAMMPNMSPNPSGRTLLDGETEIGDLSETEANKARVAKLYETLTGGSWEEAGAALEANFQPEYKQHNPRAADGLQGFLAAMPAEQWVFTKQHKVIGEGNFVLSIAEGTHKGVHSVFYDLLRFEGGKVAEHWDVIQAIPTEGLANENTMFGF